MKWQGFFRSFVFALRGVRVASRERNFRVMAAAGAVAVVCGLAVDLSQGEWIAMVTCIGLVLAMETVNSALESLANTVHPEQHPGIAAAKDLAAGASLLVSLASAAVGTIVFWPHVFS